MTDMDRELSSFAGTEGDGDRFERLVQAILAAAEPELARRRTEFLLVSQFDAWSRKVLAAAAMLVLFFGSLLLLAGRGQAAGSDEIPLLAEVVLPSPLALWMRAETEPTLVEFVRTLEEDWR